MVSIAINNVFVWKNNEIWKKNPKQNLQKRRVAAYFRHFRPKKNFLKNRILSCFEHYYYASLCKKSEKTNDKISRKCQKIGFSSIFSAFPAKNFFFENRAPSHFGHCHFASLCENQKKLMSRTQEKLVTDRRTNERTNERTNGQRLIYRTSWGWSKKTSHMLNGPTWWWKLDRKGKK